MSDAGQQGPERTAADRLRTWLAIAERHSQDVSGYRLYPGDWASLASALREALGEMLNPRSDTVEPR